MFIKLYVFYFRGNVEDLDHKLTARDVLKLHKMFLPGMTFLAKKNFKRSESLMTEAMEASDRYKSTNSSCLTIYLISCEMLGSLWKKRNDLPRSLKFYIKADKVYHDFKDKLETSISDKKRLFTDLSLVEHNILLTFLEHVNAETLEELCHIHTSLKNEDKSITYAIAAQMKKMKLNIMNAKFLASSFMLANHFLTNNEFQAARHHLACLSCGIRKVEDAIQTCHHESSSKKLKSDLMLCKIDSSLAWGAYGLRLLHASNLYLCNIRSKPKEMALFFGNKLSGSDYEITDDPEVLKIQKQVHSCPVISYEDAKDIFQHSQEFT